MNKCVPLLILAIISMSLLVNSAVKNEIWGLTITITSSIGGAEVRFGIANGATEHFDFGIDYPAPPPVPEGVEAYFYHSGEMMPELEKMSMCYLGPSDNLTWTLIIVYVKLGPYTDTVKLRWNSEEIAKIPENVSLYLITPGGETINMREKFEYSFEVNVPSNMNRVIFNFKIETKPIETIEYGELNVKVISIENKPLSNAEVKLVYDNNIIKSRLTDINGLIKFEEISTGRYRLIVDYMGSKVYDKEIEVVSGTQSEIIKCEVYTVKVKVSSQIIGVPLSGVNVKFTIGSNEVNIETDNNGIAEALIPKGKCIVKIESLNIAKEINIDKSLELEFKTMTSNDYLVLAIIFSIILVVAMIIGYRKIRR